MSIRMETGDGPLKHAHTPLQCRVLRVVPSSSGGPAEPTGEVVELDILRPPHESLRGGRLRIWAHDPQAPISGAFQGRDVVVEVELHMPRLGHISSGIGALEPIQ